MILGINDVEIYPCTMELLEALHELGIDSGGSPDQTATDVIAASAVIE